MNSNFDLQEPFLDTETCLFSHTAPVPDVKPLEAEPELAWVFISRENLVRDVAVQATISEKPAMAKEPQLLA